MIGFMGLKTTRFYHQIGVESRTGQELYPIKNASRRDWRF